MNICVDDEDDEDDDDEKKSPVQDKKENRNCQMNSFMYN